MTNSYKLALVTGMMLLFNAADTRAQIVTLARPTSSTRSTTRSAEISYAAPASNQVLSGAPAVSNHVVRYSGTLLDAAGNAITGNVSITFSYYQDQSSTTPLWSETQTVVSDANGRFAALIGATSPTGLPVEVFSNEDAKWLGIIADG